MLAITLISLLATFAHAHTRLFHIDTASGKGQTCFRPKAVGAENAPTFDLTSPDMQCGPSSPHTSECAVQSGETIYMAWGEANFPDHFISPGHKGNPHIYLGPRDASGTPPRDGWFKIWQGEWDPVGFWYNDKLTAQSTPGYLPVTIPANLKPGTYFLRAENMALHQARQYPGIQFFIYCAAITVTGNGNAVPAASELVSIPGYLTPTSPGVVFDLNNQKLPDGTMIYDSNISGKVYPTLGPNVAALAAGGSPANPPPPPPPTGNATTARPPTATVSSPGSHVYTPPPNNPANQGPLDDDEDCIEDDIPVTVQIPAKSPPPPPPAPRNPYTQSTPPPPTNPSPPSSLPINNPPAPLAPAPVAPATSPSSSISGYGSGTSSPILSSSLGLSIDSQIFHLAALLFSVYI